MALTGGSFVLSNLGRAARLQSQIRVQELMNLKRRIGGGVGLGGGGGGGGGQLQGFIEQLMASQASANEANEARFAEGKELLNTLGVAGKEDIDRQASAQVAKTGQDLASRGLSGTTIKQGNENQIQANAQLNKQKLDEAVAAQKVGFIERRTDQGPDMALLASLIQQNAATNPEPQGRRSRFF